MMNNIKSIAIFGSHLNNFTIIYLLRYYILVKTENHPFVHDSALKVFEIITQNEHCGVDKVKIRECLLTKDTPD